MRDKILQFLKNKPSDKFKEFNEVFDLYRKIPNPSSRLIRLCNMGYSDKNLETLRYELQKYFNISNAEILSKKNTPSDPMILNDLKKLDKQKKLRDEFSFLINDNCLDEFKILIADKITAWKNFTEAHKELVEKYFSGKLTSLEETKELQSLVVKSVENFELNRMIYDELEYYQQKGKILGKHPLLSHLLHQQQINELPATEVKHRIGIVKGYISRTKKELLKLKTKEARQKRQDRIENWEKEIELLEARIKNEK